jgi:hypothetical protein
MAPGAVAIGDGLSFTGATVLEPDAEPRQLSAYQAAVFVQSWLATAYFGGAASLGDPPADLPVSRVDVTGMWPSKKFGTGVVYYASDGTSAWVSFPPDQEPVDGPVTSAPEPSNWFRAPDRTVDAFAGTAELVDTFGTQETVPATTEAAAGDDGGDDSTAGPSAIWLLVAGAGVVVALGGVLLRRRRA